MYANVVRRMDLAFENYLAQDGNAIEPDDIPKTNNPVWILGHKYNAIQGERQHRKWVKKIETDFPIYIFLAFVNFFPDRTGSHSA